MTVRLYFTCDLHGSESCFLKFVNSGKLNIYKANVLIASGDLTGKALVPIVERDDGSYQATFLDSQEIVRSKEQLADLIKRVRNVGYYHEVMTDQHYRELVSDPKKYIASLSKIIHDTMEDWVRIAEDRLEKTGVACYLMPGNDDDEVIGEIINKSSYAVNPEDKVIDVGEGHEMISNGYSNPTPWKTLRECGEDELKAKIDNIVTRVKDVNTCIFNLHCPPFGSGLDTAPQLDKDLRPVVSAGEIVRIPVGSTAVLRAIEEYQPLAGLHGHIHESAGSAKIGKTMCFNPGSEYQSGILRGYILDFEKGKLKHWLRVEA